METKTRTMDHIPLRSSNPGLSSLQHILHLPATVRWGREQDPLPVRVIPSQGFDVLAYSEEGQQCATEHRGRMQTSPKGTASEVIKRPIRSERCLGCTTDFGDGGYCAPSNRARQNLQVNFHKHSLQSLRAFASALIMPVCGSLLA